jgi:hypothetical protein
MDAWTFMGARWWKFDFHTHTPHSTDYGRGDERLKARTPREWLLDHMSQGLDCVAVTDHNGGAWVDKLKLEYVTMERERPQGFRELVLFPGVEITVNGKIHLLAILDPTKRSSDIDSLLGACGYGNGGKGESKSSTSKSFIEVVDEIAKAHGIAIPAHVDQAAGLFVQLKDGTTLPAILTAPSIFSMEAVDRDFQCPELYTSCKADWTRIVGSDSHLPTEVGQRYSWVKMGKPSLEGLKLALMDGSLSARRYDESEDNPNRTADFVLKSIEIIDGMYCGRGSPLALEFNPWLNCIIGGRGSGKSTVLEMLRIGMRRDSFLREQLGERSEVVDAFMNFAQVPEGRRGNGALSEGTAIRIECLLNGERYRIQWSRKGDLAAIERALADGGWAASEGDIVGRFPLSIYSQKQIYEMATKPEALLSIIDEAPEVGYRDWKAKDEILRSEYRSLKTQARELETRAGEETKLRGELEDILVKLRLFEKGDNAQLLKDYQKAKAQSREIEAFDGSLADCSKAMDALFLEAISPNATVFEGSAEGGLILEIFHSYSAKIEGINARLAELKSDTARIGTEYRETLASSPWQERYERTNREYDALVRNLSAAGVGNPSEYGQFVQKKQQLESRLAEIAGIRARIGDLARMAAEQLAAIETHRRSLSEQRRRFLANALAGNAIVRMELVERGQGVDSLEMDFRGLIGRDDAAFKTEILSEDHTEGLLAPLAVDHRESLFTELKRTLSAIRSGSCDRPFGKRFTDFVAKLPPETMDAIELWFPGDSIAVSYSKGGESSPSFSPIEQGSPGQKTAAILAFILSHGHEPIVLDQPEDDLDNHLIYKLVVEQIREKKAERQMIVITHNANIVVNGDAEYVQAMGSRSAQAVVEEKGCLQEISVRRSICDIMEGGRVALEERYRRINIGDLYV